MGFNICKTCCFRLSNPTFLKSLDYHNECFWQELYVFAFWKLIWPSVRKIVLVIEKNSKIFEITKGQLISKCLFGICNSFNKRAKKIDLKSNCFCLFFGTIEDNKKTFRNLLTLKKFIRKEKGQNNFWNRIFFYFLLELYYRSNTLE